MKIMTDDMHKYLINHVQGLSNQDLTNLINTTFETTLTVLQIKAYKKNHHISSGLDGRFRKGQKAHNKGIRMKKEVYAKCANTMFKKGNIPVNHRSVGSERISKDGYVEIKVEEPNKWKLKHRFVWEKEHGPIGRNECLIFLNGDKTDTRIENLMLIERKINARLNQSGLRYKDEDSTRTAVSIAKISSVIGEKKRKKNN